MNKTSTWKNRCAAFNLSESRRRANAPPVAPKRSVSPTGNAYERAYQEVFAKLPAWRQKEVATMESTGNIDNRHYMDFVKEVAILGDKYHG